MIYRKQDKVLNSLKLNYIDLSYLTYYLKSLIQIKELSVEKYLRKINKLFSFKTTPK
jgi:hypothetical protein